MYWRLGVTGSPIAHSLSPQLHVAGLALAGLDGASERYELSGEQGAQLRALMGEQVDAMSVTMPLKSVAAALCDDLNDAALELGVVSSLLWRDGRLHGATMDGEGFVDSLRGRFAFEVSHAHVVVLGAGGAARAIVSALVGEGVSSVSVLGRNEAKVADLVSRWENVHDQTVLYRPVDLIVNTTPSAGRAPTAAVMQGVSRDTVAVDITYDPRRSPWLAVHEDYGCRSSNGLAMLAYQAARQMNWWWSSDIDGGDLLKALT